MEESSLETSGT